MNPDNFTHPSTPEQPNTPPSPQPAPQLEPQAQPQITPEPQPQPRPQPVPAPELEPTSVPPTFVAQAPAASPAVSATPAAPKAASHKALAIWTLVMNLIYYCLPFIVVAIFLTIYVVGMSSGAGRDFIASMLMYAFLMFGLFAVTLLAGIAAFVLDIVYLVRARPTGAKKVLTIISLSFFGLTLLGSLAATNFNNFN